MAEKILVFEKELLKDFYGLPGVSQDLANLTDLFRLCLPRAYFVDRPAAETDETIVQVIPYVIVQSRVRFATYRRTSKSGEDRLHNKFSIGLGGHVNSDDLVAALSNPKDIPDHPKCCQELAFFHAMQRELTEEVGLRDIEKFVAKPRMIIYDDKDAVGRVHLGIVMLASLKQPIEIASAEEEIGDFGWRTRSQLTKMKDQLEGWSQMCLEHI